MQLRMCATGDVTPVVPGEKQLARDAIAFMRRRLAS
jgi:hypothetical protein